MSATTQAPPLRIVPGSRAERRAPLARCRCHARRRRGDGRSGARRRWLPDHHAQRSGDRRVVGDPARGRLRGLAGQRPAARGAGLRRACSPPSRPSPASPRCGRPSAERGVPRVRPRRPLPRPLRRRRARDPPRRRPALGGRARAGHRRRSGCSRSPSACFPGVLPEGDIAAPAARRRDPAELPARLLERPGDPPRPRRAAAAARVAARRHAVAGARGRRGSSPLPALAGAMYLTSSRGGFAVAVGSASRSSSSSPRAASPRCRRCSSARRARSWRSRSCARHPALVDGPQSAAARDEGPGVAALIVARLPGLRRRLAAALAALVPRGCGCRAPVAAAAACSPSWPRSSGSPPPTPPSASAASRRRRPSRPRTGLHPGPPVQRRRQRALAVLGRGGRPVRRAPARRRRRGLLRGLVGAARRARLVRPQRALAVARDARRARAGRPAAARRRLRGGPGRRRRGGLRRRGRTRTATVVAALLGRRRGFAIGAAIDWIWQVPVIAGVASSASACSPGRPPRPPTGRAAAPGARFGIRARRRSSRWLAHRARRRIPLLVSDELERQPGRASARGDLAEALDRARSARAIQPWAASPHLQLALVREEQGELAAARARTSPTRSSATRATGGCGSSPPGWPRRTATSPPRRAQLREARRLSPRSYALRERDR